MSEKPYLRAGDVLAITQLNELPGSAWEGPMTIEAIYKEASGYDGFSHVRRIIKIEADGVVTDVTDEWQYIVANELQLTEDDSIPDCYDWCREAIDDLIAEAEEERFDPRREWGTY